MDEGTLALAIIIIEIISVSISILCSRWFYQHRLDRHRIKVQESLSQPLERVVLSQSKHDSAYHSSVFVFFLLSWLFSTMLFTLATTLYFSSIVGFLTQIEGNALLWISNLGFFALYFAIILICNLVGYFVGMRSMNTMMKIVRGNILEPMID
jgi:hypothetical protein